VVNESHFESFGALVVVAVVERLDVEQHGVAVVLPGFGTLKNTFIILKYTNAHAYIHAREY
jgi:hypothetical protein